MRRQNPRDSGLRDFKDKINKSNIERRFMERDLLFSQDSKYFEKQKLKNMKFSSRNSKTGEITGEQFVVDELEQGMPMRQLIQDHDVDNIAYNPKLDFDLYDKDSTIDITYHDPKNTPYSNLDEVSAPILNDKESNPLLIYTLCTNSFSAYILRMFRSVLKKDKSYQVILSPLSILNTLSILYRASRGETQEELYRSIYFKHKEMIYRGVSDVINQLKKQPDLYFYNFVLSTTDINKTYQKYVSGIGMLIPIGKDYKREASRINDLASKYTNGMFTNIIAANDLVNSQVTGISIMFSKTNWLYPFPKSLTQHTNFKYKSAVKRVVSMCLYDKRLNYTDDSEYQVLELDYKNRMISMGFILPKHNILPKITEQQLNKYIDRLTPNYISIVQIPRFIHEGKYRLNGVLNKMSINKIFHNATLTDMTPNSTKLSNILHHCAIIVDEGSDQQAPNKTHGPMINPSNNVFIADHPFIYYLRYKPLNLILLMGIMV